MKRFAAGIWGRIVEASILETDSPEMLRRKATLVVIALLSCAAGIISALNASVHGAPIADLALPTLYVSVVGVALLLFFVTKRFGLLLHPFLFMMLATPVVYQWSTGGLAGPGTVSIVLWSLLAPLGALMFQNVRNATALFAIYLLLVASGMYLDDAFTHLAVAVPHAERMIAHAISIGGLSTTIFVTTTYFVVAFQTEHTKVEALVADLTDANGRLEVTLSELQETQAELIQSEKTASLGKLAAGIAHEINNPIGALKSTADVSRRCVARIEQLLVEDDTSLGARTATRFSDLLQILKDNNDVFSSVSDRVSQTVGSFISFTHLDQAEFGTADLRASIDNTLKLLHQEIRQGTSIVREYGDIPKIACYPGELNQVFLQLLTNAAQAIEGEGQITIRTSAEAGKVRIEIEDTGAGIPPEQVQELFDPHFVRDGSRVKAGLGLLTSQSIVQKHRGRIEVQSEVGKGTTFSVVLPTNLEHETHIT